MIKQILITAFIFCLPFSLSSQSDESKGKGKGKVNSPKIKSVEKPYAFKERGWHFGGGIAGIEEGSIGNSRGHAIEIGAVYHFSRLFGIGINTGIDIYSNNSNEKIVPLYVNIQGFALPTKVTPFYSIGIGVGIPSIEETEWEVITSNPGLLLYPKIGVRLTGNKDYNMTVFTGYKIQNLKIRRSFGCNGGAECEEFIEQDKSFRRIILGVGFTF